MRHAIKHAAWDGKEHDSATRIETGVSYVDLGMELPPHPVIHLTSHLPAGREDLALFLAQRLHDCVRQFKNDYLREELL